MNKVILIGPSKSLLKDKLGKKIDSFDVVCRMNLGGAPVIVNEENKSFIGTKKNVWLCKHLACFNMFPDPGYDKLVGFAQGSAMYPMTPETISKFSHVVQQASKKGAETLDSCIQILKSFNNFNSRPSCGILSIFYLLERYNKIYICGMDGFKGGHWYGNKFMNGQDESDKLAVKGIGAHNIFKEREYIDYLVKQNKIKIIDE